MNFYSSLLTPNFNNSHLLRIAKTATNPKPKCSGLSFWQKFIIAP
jgi:hypothetical protein